MMAGVIIATFSLLGWVIHQGDETARALEADSNKPPPEVAGEYYDINNL